MRIALLAASALMLGLPALAQTGSQTGSIFRDSQPPAAAPSQAPSPGTTQGGSVTQPRTPDQMQRHRQEFPVQGAGAGASGQQHGTAAMSQAARQAEQANVAREADALVRQAEQALSRGNRVLANEYLERAETSLLNRHVLPGAGSAEGGQQEGRALRAVAEARAALNRGDRRAAAEAIRTAQAETGRIGQAPGTPPAR